MSWKVLITARTLDVAGKAATELLRRNGVELVIPPRYGPLPAEELLKLLPGVDAVFASMDQFTAEVLGSPAAASLKLISRWGVGYDAIDVPAATRHGIVVAYTPGLLDDAVADYAFALLLAVARRVHEGYASMRRGEWKSLWGHDVSGKTLGIVGCGRIGRAVARRAGGFGMRLLGFDILPSTEAEKGGIRFTGLDELLAESDFVTVHAALTPQTRGLMGEARLRQMKRSAYLINTARGAIVDEAALARALTEGWIAGAAVDAFVVEPLPADHPLRSVPNLLLTPHQASFGYDTGERVSTMAAQAIIDLMQGRRPQAVVDPAVWQSPALRARLK
ncbi:MAG TPA: phosphoglycerate dehydrogenase [Methylomirabilota bacterium]|nr:phosphoglycerate dehydrogenase [Methylomirabilota bacterium]